MSRGVFRNSVLNLMGTLAPMAVALITVPLFVRLIGMERYGALALTWVFLGYFGQADFGIGRGVTQRIAQLADGEHAARAHVFYSGLLVIAVIGAVMGLAAVLLAKWYFAGPFEISSEPRTELVRSTWLVALFVPIVALYGVAVGSLSGREDFLAVSTINLVSNSLLPILPLIVAAAWTTDLAHLLAASLAARLVGLVMALLRVRVTMLVGTRPAIKRSEVQGLFHFGKWLMITALIGPLMHLADRFVIGTQLGAIAVAAYVIPYQIANRTQSIPAAIGQVLFPRLAAADPRKMRRSCAHFAVVMGLVYGIPLAVLIAMADPLLRLWLGADLDPRSVLLARIILAGFWINGVAQVPFAFIQARGNSRATALLHLAETPFYFAILFGLGAAFGLTGIAAAFALRCAADCLALTVMGRLNLAAIAARLALPAAILLGSVLLHPWLTGWLPSIIAAAVSCGILAMLAWRAVPAEYLELISTRFLRRKPAVPVRPGGE